MYRGKGEIPSRKVLAECTAVKDHVSMRWYIPARQTKHGAYARVVVAESLYTLPHSI